MNFYVRILNLSPCNYTMFVSHESTKVWYIDWKFQKPQVKLWYIILKPRSWGSRCTGLETSWSRWSTSLTLPPCHSLCFIILQALSPWDTPCHLSCFQLARIHCLGRDIYTGMRSRINTTEKTLLEKIDSCTLLLKSCIMSSYFESTISDCSVASILYTLWPLWPYSYLKLYNNIWSKYKEVVRNFLVETQAMRGLYLEWTWNKRGCMKMCLNN